MTIRSYRLPTHFCRWLALCTLLLTSCQQDVESDSPATASKPQASADIWSIALIDGTKIGYSRIQQSVLEEDGQSLWKHDQLNEITLQRSGTTTRQRTELTSVETRQGKLLRCQTQMSDGGHPTLATAHVSNDQLIVTTEIAGQKKQSSLPWKPEWRGFFGVEQSLRERPLQPEEKRQLTVLAPVLMQPAIVALKAANYEATTVTSGTKNLLRIERSDQLQVADGQTITIKSTLWVDEAGEILKTLLPGLGLEEYRTSRQDALAKTGTRPFDINASFSIPLKRAIAQPHATRLVRYRVHVRDGQAADFFAQGPSQRITPLENGWAQIDVQAISPGSQTTAPRQPPPTPADTAANSLIQSDNALIVTMAKSVGSKTDDPWQLACQLEKHVARLIETKDFSRVFASAAEVVQSRQGDCTEHAVLLAALCRARQIPTRVVIGLVYVPRPGAPELAYHMWNEVWIKNGWFPLDATLGQGGIGAGHLKLSDSNLSGASAFSAFLPVTQVVRRLQLEIVAAE